MLTAFFSISVITDIVSGSATKSNIMGTNSSYKNESFYTVSKAYNMTTDMPVDLSSPLYQTNVSSITISSSSAYEFWEYVYVIL